MKCLSKNNRVEKYKLLKIFTWCGPITFWYFAPRPCHVVCYVIRYVLLIKYWRCIGATVRLMQKCKYICRRERQKVKLITEWKNISVMGLFSPNEWVLSKRFENKSGENGSGFVQSPRCCRNCLLQSWGYQRQSATVVAARNKLSWNGQPWAPKWYLDCKVHGANMGPSGADRTQVGPMLAPRTLLSG